MQRRKSVMRIEVEVYPGYWIEMDPHDLYDDRHISLADCLASGSVKKDMRHRQLSESMATP
jgi:hypothetical protein